MVRQEKEKETTNNKQTKSIHHTKLSDENTRERNEQKQGTRQVMRRTGLPQVLQPAAGESS